MPLYKIRADLQVNDGRRTLVFVAILNETPAHLGLKLAAYLSFWEQDLALEAGAKHPALAGTDFRPDLLGADLSGQITHWIECGRTSSNKIEKVLRKWPDATLAVFKESEFAARQFRREVLDEMPRGERVELYCWKDGGFAEWMDCLAEKIEVFGDCGGGKFNLVIGEKIYTEDLLKI